MEKYYKVDKKNSNSFWDPTQKKEFDEQISGDQIGKFDETAAVLIAKRNGRIIECSEKEYLEYKKSMAVLMGTDVEDKKVLETVKKDAKKIIDETNQKAKEIIEQANSDASQIIELAKEDAKKIIDDANVEAEKVLENSKKPNK